MTDTINDRKNALYLAVGMALSRWNELEHALSILFTRAMALDFNNYTHKAFWAVLSFEAKLKMSDAVLKERFRNLPDYLEVWNSLSPKLIARNRVRNKIAHGTVIHARWTTPGKTTKEDVFLSPYYFSGDKMDLKKVFPLTEHFDPRPKGRMYAGDIRRSEQVFCAAEKQMIDLANRFFQSEILPKLPKSEGG